MFYVFLYLNIKSPQVLYAVHFLEKDVIPRPGHKANINIYKKWNNSLYLMGSSWFKVRVQQRHKLQKAY